MASVRQLTKPNREGKRPWVVEYTDQNGARHRHTPKSGLKRDAEKARIKIENEVEGRVHVAASETVTIAEAAEQYLTKCEKRVAAKDNLRNVSFVSYGYTVRKHIVPHLGRTLLSKVSVRDVQQWVDDLSSAPDRAYGRPVVERALVILGYILNHGVASGYVARNVITKGSVRVPGRPSKQIDIPQKDQIRVLLQHVDRNVRGGRAGYLRPVVYLAIFAGLRMGEIRALRWENVDLSGGLVRVRHGVDRRGHVDDPKSRAGIRDVPLVPEALRELTAWHEAKGRPQSGFVFTRGSGKGRVRPDTDPAKAAQPLLDTALGNSWRRLQAHALLGRTWREGEDKLFNFHALRHVYASLLIEAGLPPKRVQYLMGHSSIQMTFDRYGHLFEDPDLVKSAIANLGTGLVPASPGSGRDENATSTLAD